MAGNRSIEQHFANFVGLDVRSSDLTRPANAAKEVKNFEIEKNFTLGGSKGFKTSCNRSGDLSTYPNNFICAIHNYKYRDIDTGEDKEEIIGIGQLNLFKLVEEAFTINYTGGGAYWGYEFLLDTDNNYHFKLYDESTEVLDYNAGTGLEDDTTTAKTLANLEAAIDAIADFTADCPTTLDGKIASIFPLSQSLNETGASATVQIQNWQIVIDNSKAGAGTLNFPFVPYSKNHNKVDTQPPVFINKDNVCYICCGGKTPLYKYDGVNIVQAGVPEIIEEDIEIEAVANTPALVGSFRYYARVVRRDVKGNFIYGRGAKTDFITTASGEAPKVKLWGNSSTNKGLISTSDSNFSQALQGIYLGATTSLSSDTNVITLFDPYDLNKEANLKYYGYDLLSVGDLLSFTSSVGVTVPQSQFVITEIDRENNQIILDRDISIDATGNLRVFKDYTGLKPKYVKFNNTQSSVSTFDVSTHGDYSVKVGDVLYFKSEDNWLTVTAVGASTVTVDGKVDTTAGDWASDTIVEIYRTENEGVEKFYLSDRIPIMEVCSPSSSYIDEVADADLTEEIIIPDKESDHLKIFPTAIAEHQGVTIATGGKRFPNRLFYEDVEFPESFPLATNFYDVPSKDAGSVTAIWSDTFDQLAVFKESAYYSVVGDFTEDIPFITTTANTENDIGISSQASIVKVRGLNIGVGALGLVAFKGGEVDYELTKQLDSEFLVTTVGDDISDNMKLRTNRAISVNDKLKQQAYFFIPAFNINGDTHEGANDSSKLYVLDYSENAWLRRSFPGDLSAGASGLIPYPFLPTAGVVVYQDRLYFSSMAYDSTLSASNSYDDFHSFLFRRHEKAITTNSVSDYRYDYADQHKAIEYDYQSQWYYGDTPLLDKLFQYLKIYTFFTTDSVPFTLRVRTYLDWDLTTAIDDISLSVTSSTPAHLIKLQANRGQALMVRFTVNAIHTKPTITGYELLPAEIDLDTEGVR